jgi:hypothetical protein
MFAQNQHALSANEDLDPQKYLEDLKGKLTQIMEMDFVTIEKEMKFLGTLVKQLACLITMWSNPKCDPEYKKSELKAVVAMLESVIFTLDTKYGQLRSNPSPRMRPLLKQGEQLLISLNITKPIYHHIDEVTPQMLHREQSLAREQKKLHENKDFIRLKEWIKENFFSRYKIKRVFSSHAWPIPEKEEEHHEDWTMDFATIMAEDIDDTGIMVEHDTARSGGGKVLQIFMDDNIEKVDHVVVFVSRTMAHKYWEGKFSTGVKNEYTAYVDRFSREQIDRFIIPIILNEKNNSPGLVRGIAEISPYKEGYLKAFLELICILYGLGREDKDSLYKCEHLKPLSDYLKRPVYFSANTLIPTRSVHVLQAPATAKENLGEETTGEMKSYYAEMSNLAGNRPIAKFNPHIGDGIEEYEETENELHISSGKSKYSKEKINLHGRLLVNNIPAKNLHFTGRENLLNKIENCLGNNSDHFASCVITGLGGQGKTQTIIEYVHRYKYRYQLIWWFDTEANLDSAYRQLAMAMNENLLGDNKINVKNSSPKEIKHKVWNNLCNHPKCKRWLLVFDDFESEEFLRANLPGEGDYELGHIAVTSRIKYWQQIMSLPIAEFSREESIELLCSYINEKAPSKKSTFSEEEMVAASQLADDLGDLPLALAQAGAFSANNGTIGPLQNYHELIKEERNKQSLSSQRLMNYKLTVATTWNITIRKIKNVSPLALRLLNYCAYFNSNHIPIFILKALVDDAKFLEAIKILVNYSMVNVISDEILSVHKLVQKVICNTHSTREQKRYLTDVLKSLHQYFRKDAQSLNDIKQNLVLLAHIEEAVKQYKKRRFTDFDLSIFDQDLIHSYLVYMGNFPQSISRIKEALGRLGIELELLNYWFKKGDGHQIDGKNTTFLTNALGADFTQICKSQVADLLEYLGLTFLYMYRQDIYTYSLTSYFKDEVSTIEQSVRLLNLAVMINEHVHGESANEVAISLTNLALAIGQAGDFNQQKKLLERALGIKASLHGLKDRRIWQLGHSECPEKILLEQSIRLFNRAYGRGHHPEVALVLHHLGNTYTNASYRQRSLQQASAIYMDIYGEESLPLTEVKQELALSYAQSGYYHQAMEHLKEAQETLERLYEQYVVINESTIKDVLTTLPPVDRALEIKEQFINLLLKDLHSAFNSKERKKIIVNLTNIGISRDRLIQALVKDLNNLQVTEAVDDLLGLEVPAEEIKEQLFLILKKDDLYRWGKVASCLVKLDEKKYLIVQFFLNHLNDERPRVRQEAVEEIVKLGVNEEHEEHRGRIVAVLIDNLQASDVRDRAINTLIDLNEASGQVIEHLCANLTHGNEEVKRKAASKLIKLGEKAKAMKILRHQLTDASPEERFKIASLLIDTKEEENEGIRVLVHDLYRVDNSLRQRINLLLESVNDKKLILQESLKYLEDEELIVRQLAAEEIIKMEGGEQHVERVIGVLVNNLQAINNVRDMAIDALIDINEARELVIELLCADLIHGDTRVKRTAMRKLIKLGENVKAMEILHHQLTDASPEERFEIASLLIDFKEEENKGIRILLIDLYHIHNSLRKRIMSLLLKLENGRELILRESLKHLEDEVTLIRQAAVEVIIELKEGKNYRELIVQTLKKNLLDDATKAIATVMLSIFFRNEQQAKNITHGKIERKWRKISEWLNILQDNNAQVRQSATERLISMNISEAFPQEIKLALRRNLEDSDARIALKACKTLFKLKINLESEKKQILQVLMNNLKHENTRVRQNAIALLPKLNLDDEKEQVKVVVLQNCNNKIMWEKLEAAECYIQLGGNKEDVLAALVECLNFENQRVSRRAQEIINTYLLILPATLTNKIADARIISSARVDTSHQTNNGKEPNFLKDSAVVEAKLKICPPSLSLFGCQSKKPKSNLPLNSLSDFSLVELPPLLSEEEIVSEGWERNKSNIKMLAISYQDEYISQRDENILIIALPVNENLETEVWNNLSGVQCILEELKNYVTDVFRILIEKIDIIENNMIIIGRNSENTDRIEHLLNDSGFQFKQSYQLKKGF